MNNLASRPPNNNLLSLGVCLRGDVSAMADKDTDQFEQEFTRSLVQNDEETLQWFADALDHIERGAYGACERKISQQRLNVLSFTAYYVKCASEIQAG